MLVENLEILMYWQDCYMHTYLRTMKMMFVIFSCSQTVQNILLWSSSKWSQCSDNFFYFKYNYLSYIISAVYNSCQGCCFHHYICVCLVCQQNNSKSCGQIPMNFLKGGMW